MSLRGVAEAIYILWYRLLCRKPPRNDSSNAYPRGYSFSIMSESSHEFGYVYACYDPAIRDGVLKYCEKRFGKGNYFFDTDPGAARNLAHPRKESDADFVMWKMRLAAKVHPYTHLLLINHSICGAYADAGIIFESADAEQARHKNDLEHAADLLKSKLPAGIKIETRYFLKKEQQFAW